MIFWKNMLQIGGVVFVQFDSFLNYAMNMTNITNYKLAKQLNVSQTTVANWLNGISEPREKRRIEVLNLFGVTESDLKKGFPEIHYTGAKQQEKPATESGDGLDESLIKKLMQLTPDEIQKVDAFVQGLIANRSA